jgi:hypothetical protein
MAYVDIDHSPSSTELKTPLVGESRLAAVIEDAPNDPANRRLRM